MLCGSGFAHVSVFCFSVFYSILISTQFFLLSIYMFNQKLWLFPSWKFQHKFTWFVKNNLNEMFLISVDELIRLKNQNIHLELFEKIQNRNSFERLYILITFYCHIYQFSNKMRTKYLEFFKRIPTEQQFIAFESFVLVYLSFTKTNRTFSASDFIFEKRLLLAIINTSLWFRMIILIMKWDNSHGTQYLILYAWSHRIIFICFQIFVENEKKKKTFQ